MLPHIYHGMPLLPETAHGVALEGGGKNGVGRILVGVGTAEKGAGGARDGEAVELG